MQQNKKQKIQKAKTRFRKIMKLGTMSVAILLSCFIIFISLIVCFVPVRQYFISQTINVANNFLLAKISVKDIYFKGIDNVIINNVIIKTEQDTLANIQKINIQFNLKSLLTNSIQINKIELTKPQIALLRSTKDSLWNYNKIVKSSENNEPKAQSKLNININQIIINDGNFKYWDSVNNWKPNSYFNPSQMEWAIKSFVTKNIQVGINKNLYVIDINNLTTNEVNSNINIKNFSSKIKLFESGIYANNSYLTLNNTPTSKESEANINFNAKITNFNVFSKSKLDIEEAIMSLNLDATGFNCDFIDNFQILPIKLGEVKKININSTGTLCEMQVPYLYVNIDSSKLQMQNMKLTNLTVPDKLSYQGNINNTKIIPNNIQNFLADLNLKVLEQLNQATINQTYFYGTTDSIFTKIDVKSDIGNVYGDVAIAFGKPNQEYNINIETKSLNLQKITNNSELASNINSEIKIKGNHFDINKINAEINISLYPSIINNVTFDSSTISCIYKAKDTFIINNCKIIINNQNENNSNILINGGLNINDLNNPKTNLNIAFANINVAKMLNNVSFPKTLSGDISIVSEGISIDNLTADAKINIEEIMFNNKSLFPFFIETKIALNDNYNKLYLFADNVFEKILDLDIQGQFNIEDIIYYMNRDIKLVKSFVAQKLNDTTYKSNNIKQLDEIFKNYNKVSEKHNKTIKKYDKVNFTMKITTDGLGYLDFIDDNIVIENTNINANINYQADSSKTNINIDSISIYALKIINDANKIQLDSLYINSEILINNDSLNSINLLNIAVNSNKPQQYNNLKINNLHSNILYNYDKISFNVAGNLNNLLNLNSNGYISMYNNDLAITMDTFMLGTNNYYLKNHLPIDITYSEQKINIKQFNLTNNNEENLKITGILDINNTLADNLTIKINDISVDNMRKNIFTPLNINIPKISGYIDSAIIVANGKFNNPIITGDVNIINLNYDNYSIGKFRSNLNYMNKNISANADINSQQHNNLLSLVVTKLPISLALDSNFANIDTNEQIDIVLKIKELPSQIIAPFVPQIDKLSGLINADFNIMGYLPDKYEYKGQLELKNLKMRIIPINMQYMATGTINANTNIISFNSLKLKNMQHDLNKGEVNINGKIKLKGFELDSFDIVANTKQFQILNDNSQTEMPFLFGKMIIATDEQPLRIYGTLHEPNLSGSIYVLNADLKMPQILQEQVTKIETKFKYINKDDLNVNISNTYDAEIYKNNSQQTNFIDLLNIDLNLRINKFAIALELGTLGSIFARVGTKEPNAQLNYKKIRTSKEAKLYGGELEILDGSTLQIYKTMSAKGTISFPTARVSQPTLNLTAEYKGKTTTDYPVNYSVFVDIKGNSKNPIVDLNYSVNGTMVAGDKQQIQLDAFNALTRGVIKGYNDDNSTNILGESNISNLLVSQIASKTLTDFFLKTGIIQSANLKFDNNDFNSANVSFSGLLGNYATWNIGGKIEDIASNYNLSVDIPFNINSEYLNNILLQLSKTTDVNSAVFDKNAKSWEINLKFNGNW